MTGFYLNLLLLNTPEEKDCQQHDVLSINLLGTRSTRSTNNQLKKARETMRIPKMQLNAFLGQE